jgi:hypothetical protein
VLKSKLNENEKIFDRPLGIDELDFSVKKVKKIQHREVMVLATGSF